MVLYVFEIANSRMDKRGDSCLQWGGGELKHRSHPLAMPLAMGMPISSQPQRYSISIQSMGWANSRYMDFLNIISTLFRC